MHQNNEQGSTMIETLLYLCVLIMLGATISKGVINVFSRYRTGRMSQQLIDLKKAISHYTAADEDYSTLTEEGMLTNKGLPLDLQNLNHAMNGKIEFGPASEIAYDLNSNNRYMFYITFYDVDKEACIEILTQGQFYGDGSEMDALIVNQSYGWNYQYSLFSLDGIAHVSQLNHQTLDLENAMRGCTRNKDNQITWIFS